MYGKTEHRAQCTELSDCMLWHEDVRAVHVWDNGIRTASI